MNQTKLIKDQIKRVWGAGWDRLSEVQKEDFIKARLLEVLLQQDSEKMQPAVLFCEKILSELMPK